MSKQAYRTILFFVIGHCILVTITNGQSKEESIKLVRSMYAAVNQFHKAGAGYDCKKGSIRTRSQSEIYKGLYTQNANRCSYPNGYGKVSLNFEEWEWDLDAEYYYKNGKIFFIYMVESTVCGTRTYRMYYNQAGTLIRVLENIEDCTDEPQGKNNEMFNESAIRMVSSNANKHLRKALSIIQ